MLKKIVACLIPVLISCNRIEPSKPAQDQIESNSITLETLKREGDNFEKSRDIFHWVYFKTQNDLDNFTKEVAKKKYDFVKAAEIDDQFPFQLQIKIHDKISEEILKKQVSYLVEVAHKHNGDYDGWETSVEK